VIGARRLRAWAPSLRRETYALYFAARDPRLPWYVKLHAAGIVWLRSSCA
jgi:uncharacterized membrane protein YkvA (DUF1232 family)